MAELRIWREADGLAHTDLDAAPDRLLISCELLLMAGRDAVRIDGREVTLRFAEGELTYRTTAVDTDACMLHAELISTSPATRA